MIKRHIDKLQFRLRCSVNTFRVHVFLKRYIQQKKYFCFNTFVYMLTIVRF